MRALLIAIWTLIIVSCTSESDAKRILKYDGYENVQITGYRFFDCGKDDSFRTGFIATKNGRTIEGVVCGGLLKSSTIRID